MYIWNSSLLTKKNFRAILFFVLLLFFLLLYIVGSSSNAGNNPALILRGARSAGRSSKLSVEAFLYKFSIT